MIWKRGQLAWCTAGQAEGIDCCVHDGIGVNTRAGLISCASKNGACTPHVEQVSEEGKHSLLCTDCVQKRAVWRWLCAKGYVCRRRVEDINGTHERTIHATSLVVDGRSAGGLEAATRFEDGNFGSLDCRILVLRDFPGRRGGRQRDDMIAGQNSFFQRPDCPLLYTVVLSSRRRCLCTLHCITLQKDEFDSIVEAKQRAGSRAHQPNNITAVMNLECPGRVYLWFCFPSVDRCSVTTEQHGKCWVGVLPQTLPCLLIGPRRTTTLVIEHADRSWDISTRRVRHEQFRWILLIYVYRE